MSGSNHDGGTPVPDAPSAGPAAMVVFVDGAPFVNDGSTFTYAPHLLVGKTDRPRRTSTTDAERSPGG